ncbi:UNKNOWN [Stylonychia lemnae]|uniref:Uncharacterized protein n=1 Tax=Stylonychia lemnae TaxID=5949 RepID=A0A078AR66_STYLE|nr:UNKNOWN [Stylonychia lemnae]|eukprot:CDW84461.1 UNKNOWN [Stylonychia lemnae]
MQQANNSTNIDDYSMSLDFGGSPYSLQNNKQLNQSFKLPSNSMLINSSQTYGLNEDLSVSFKKYDQQQFQGNQGIQKVVPSTLDGQYGQQQQSPYRDFSVDKLNQRHNIPSSGGTNLQQDINSSTKNLNPQMSTPYHTYKEGAHQIKNHGAAMLRNHIGVNQNIIMLNNQGQSGQTSIKASINGGLALPPSIGSTNIVHSKKIFQENNVLQSPGLMNQNKKSSILDNIQPISIDKGNMMMSQAPQQNLNNSQMNATMTGMFNQGQQNSQQQQISSNFTSPLINSTKHMGLNDISTTRPNQGVQNYKQQERQLQSFANKELDDFLREDYTQNNKRNY